MSSHPALRLAPPRSRLSSPQLLPHQRRLNSTYQAPDRPPKPNLHRNFYRQFGRPVAKNFLIALAVYQALYWSWLKLESVEVRQEKAAEIAGLETELEGLQGKVRRK